ncbi:MAG: hypothetical protein Greene041619_140 [Candidatus Peregrinibacteria bacterium Greene0416_19]|nr:MAG: hypothetical protein Greene041619_140 [Candidatus Peregrinibacteria bacterium Greene0416_19]
MHIPSLLKQPLVKQLLGAGAGALVALALYSAYAAAAPRVTALIVRIPGDAARTYTDEEREQNLARLVELVRESLTQYQ